MFDNDMWGLNHGMARNLAERLSWMMSNNGYVMGLILNLPCHIPSFPSF